MARSPVGVLHLIDTGGPGGAETVFRELSKGLDVERWRVIPVLPKVDWLWDALVRDGLRPKLAEYRWGRLPYLARLWRLARSHDVDIIHTHLLGSAVYGSILGRILGIPVISTFHGLPDFAGSGRLHELKLKVLAKIPERIVFVSDSLREHVSDRYDLPEDRVSIVPNGVELQPQPANGREREELNAQPREFFVGAVGNVRPSKDYPTLLRAVAKLREQGVPIRLAVLGQGRGSLFDEILALTRELDIGDVVTFHSFRDDARRLISGFDVLALSSSSEGFSLATIESLASGKPVVATRCGGPEEIIRDGETGLLVPVGDPDSLAEALALLWNHPGRRREMGARGRADVRDRFGLARMISNYEGQYAAVLGLE